MMLHLLLWVLVVLLVMLELELGVVWLWMLLLWPRDLGGVWHVRVELGVGNRGGKVVRI
jgi:hypothetical protein